MAAFCAPQRPVLEPGSRRGDPLHLGRAYGNARNGKSIGPGQLGRKPFDRTFLIFHGIVVGFGTKEGFPTYHPGSEQSCFAWEN